MSRQMRASDFWPYERSILRKLGKAIHGVVDGLKPAADRERLDLALRLLIEAAGEVADRLDSPRLIAESGWELRRAAPARSNRPRRQR